MNLSPNEHVRKLHTSGKGFVSLAQKLLSKWMERFYPQYELDSVVNDWSGNDIYVSQNSFIDKKRSLVNIETLENLYIDLDCYKLGFSPEQALTSVEYLADEGDIPYPNISVMSGRGLQLIWNITPETSDKIPLWKSVEDWLCGELKHLGADSQSTDVSRVLRLPGSKHSINGKQVYSLDYHQYKFNLDFLHQKYVPASIPKSATKAKAGQIKYMFTLRTLFWARIRDIWHLVKMRGGHCEGCRETILFLYRYHACRYTYDQKQALKETLELNKMFSTPLSIKEATSATKSAERAFLNDNKYRYRTQKIIDLLDITEEEQKEMKNLISKKEKRLREKIKRFKGVSSEKFRRVIETYQAGITGIRAISRETGIGINTVRKYLVMDGCIS